MGRINGEERIGAWARACRPSLPSAPADLTFCPSLKCVPLSLAAVICNIINYLSIIDSYYLGFYITFLHFSRNSFVLSPDIILAAFY